jgi:hypothetical protein
MKQRAPMFVVVKAIMILFRLIIDIENLADMILRVCGHAIHNECIHRLGMLNYCNYSNKGNT